MANLEIEGTLTRKLAVQSGRSARGDWAKQEFLLEFQEGKFPTTAVFSVWGQDKVQELAGVPEGTAVVVAFNISSREYNGKWYTDLRAWKITPATAAAQAAPAPAASAPVAQPRPVRSQDVPAGFTAAPAPTLDDMPGDESDDLPF